MFKIFSGLIDSNEKVLKRLVSTVDLINSLEPQFESLSNEQLRGKTDEFRQRLDDGESLDDILPEAFAAVREAAKRTIKQRHFDVQLIGGIVLHQGRIAEMKTGEGKTLVATLPVYLNALDGKGVHVVTVNDYLSKRDCYWMGPIYHLLGLSVATIQHEAQFVFDPGQESEDATWRHLRPVKRREAYAADITYGTNNEFGFDYLRDNMVGNLSQCVQRPLNYAIVDEVDYILIDEARTPLIISGPGKDETLLHKKAAVAVRNLRGLNQRDFDDMKKQLGEEAAEAKKNEEYDYVFDEKERNIAEVTHRGQNKIAAHYGDPDMYGGDEWKEEVQTNADVEKERGPNQQRVKAALTVKELYRKDREYVVREEVGGGMRKKEIVIVDEFTGRMMPGRRWSDAIHEAIEVKEDVPIQRKSITMATITFQNYFRMYGKLAGMTGTAVTEAEELHKIYKLEVVIIPPNKPMIRKDQSDQIYQNEEAKFRAVAGELEELYKAQRPVLVGTVSIEKSEHLSEMLTRRGVPHQVLNAKQHEREAAIVAQAGRLGSVTVATNMAGRGVDIILGGNPEGRETADWQKEHNRVVELGGLHILGTERHEARRIDNQLRGRSGRQGDPGSSRFYVSMEDDIMRRFGGDRVRGIMQSLHMDEDMPIENRIVNKTIEGSQTRIEGHNFDIRKHLVEYDDVLNEHRRVIYNDRRNILIKDAVHKLVETFLAADRSTEWDIRGFLDEVAKITSLPPDLKPDAVAQMNKLEIEKILPGADYKANIQSMIAEELCRLVSSHLPEQNREHWDVAGLLREVNNIMPLPPGLEAKALPQMNYEEVEQRLLQHAESLYQQREQEFGAEKMRMLERIVMLHTIDRLWIDHLNTMDEKLNAAGLEAVGGRDPLVMYKHVGQDMFEELKADITHYVVHTIFKVRIEERGKPLQKSPMEQAAQRRESAAVGAKKVGRNEPCPCGSGKKYKKCCGR